MDATDVKKNRIFAVAFGVADLLAAFVVLLGVFAGLPARWWPVDAAAVLVILAFGSAGVGLIRGAAWAPRVARIAAFLALGTGLVLVTILAITVSYLNGIYGPVGRGGAIILTLVAALALPYLVALPALKLVWLGPRDRKAEPSPGAAHP